NLISAWIDSRRAARELELKIVNVEGGSLETRIVVTGGLPPLPGAENLIMPNLSAPMNGQALESPEAFVADHGPVIDHPQDAQSEATPPSVTYPGSAPDTEAT